MKRIKKKYKRYERRNKGGRPTVMTPDVIAKLEGAFAIDATVEEACTYAGIGRDAFYDYLKKTPKFNDTIASLRQRPVLKARTTVVGSLGNPDYAFRYLEKKRKAEFGNALDITSGGERIVPMPAELIEKHSKNEASSSTKSDSE